MLTGSCSAVSPAGPFARPFSSREPHFSRPGARAVEPSSHRAAGDAPQGRPLPRPFRRVSTRRRGTGCVPDGSCAMAPEEASAQPEFPALRRVKVRDDDRRREGRRSGDPARATARARRTPRAHGSAESQLQGLKPLATHDTPFGARRLRPSAQRFAGGPQRSYLLPTLS
jgi:hypothetical protein